MIDWMVFLLQIGIMLCLVFLIFEYQVHLRAHRKIKEDVERLEKSTTALHGAYLKVLDEEEKDN